MEMDVEFEGFLRRSNLADNTIKAYLYAVKQYCSRYEKVTKSNLQKYKLFLLENYKPKTVNLRIRAVNCYLEAIGKEKLALSSVKVQQKTYLENVISDADYMYFKECLRRDGEWFWYFVIRFMAATGARVSELVQIKAEHVQTGYLDLYSKGGKIRRIYIPSALREEAMQWIKYRGIESGFPVLKPFGRPHYHQGNRRAAEEIRCPLRDTRGSGLSPFLPPPVREEFPGEILRHRASGRFNGA